MDIIQLIEADHRQIDGLFHHLERAEDARQRGRVARQLVRELSVHAAVEEQVLYPALARVGLGPERLDSLEEHHAVKVMLAELQATNPAQERYAAKARVVARSVRRHVEEEEATILPQLRQSLGAETLRQLGVEFRRLRQSAPTRPHPTAPDQPPANVVINAAAALVDRLRDAIMEAGELVRATVQQLFERALQAGRGTAARAHGERVVRQVRVLGAAVAEGTAKRGADLADRLGARVAPAAREVGRRVRGMARARRVPEQAARKAGARAKDKKRAPRRRRGR